MNTAREYIGTAKAMCFKGLIPEDCELSPLTVCHNHRPAQHPEVADTWQGDLEIWRDSPVIMENM